MNSVDIRVEVVDVISTALAEGEGYIAGLDTIAARHYNMAEKVADALDKAGLLPRFTEVNHIAGVHDGRYQALIAERYVTGWTTRPEFENS